MKPSKTGSQKKRRAKVKGGHALWRALCRAYLDLQQLRMAVQSRVRRLRARPGEEEAAAILEPYVDELSRFERSWLRDAVERMKDHPLLQWCRKVRGMGDVAALVLRGFVNPECNTAGSVWAYFGLVPGQRLRAGQRGGYNPEAKGRGWFIAKNVIMARNPGPKGTPGGDCYYKPLYDAKRRYYLEQPRTERRVVAGRVEWVKWPPFQEIIDDPSKCPDYEPCKERLRKKAARLGRPVKRPSCRAHCDNLARRWLLKLLLSNALEIIREAEGLDVSAIRSHRSYIRPKPTEDATPPPSLLEQIARGQPEGEPK